MSTRTTRTTRTLLYFPIVHSQSDMGSLGGSIREITLKKLGARVWHKKVNLIARYWSVVEDTLRHLAIVYKRTRLYQDGLPVCGKELEIVKELAEKGSLNHQLLVHLIEKGATVMGTESPDLLVEEYKRIHYILESGDLHEAVRVETMEKSAGDLLLAKRDTFIAARIDQTLLAGETGILFMGMLHDVTNYLAKDIQISFPMPTSLR